MESSFLRLVLLILFFIEWPLVQGGLIRGWDIIVNYSNRNLLSTYAFVFQLETPLDSSDKMMIEMPYLLHSTVSSTSPVELTAVFGKISYSSCDSSSNVQTTDPWQYINQDQLVSVSIYVSSTTSKQYYFSLPSSVSSSLEYILLLTSTVIPLTQSVGIKDFIKLYSVSSSDPAAIIYDRNELFSAFELTSDAPSTLVVGYEVFASNQNEYEAVYEIFVEILNNQDYLTSAPSGSLYEIRFGSGSSSSFSFMAANNGLMSHICESQSSKSNGYVITAIPSSSYNCVVTSDVIKIQVTSALPSLSRLRFSFFVQNPNFTLSTKESIAVKRFKINSSQVVEMGTSIGFLSVTGILVSSRSMQVGWGMDETLQVAPLQLLPLIRNAATGLGTYNSIKFVLTLSHGTPDGVVAEVEFSIATGTNGDSTVLTGSIIHNFPETTLGRNKRVECSTTGDGPSRKIVCTNLGKLIPSTQYFVGFKMMFFNTATISSTFSQFSGYLLDPSNSYSRFTSPLISNFKISRTTTLTLSTNKNFYLPGTASTAISSQLVSSTLPTVVYSPHGDATNGILGIVPEDTLNTPQKLVFSMSILPSDITSIVDTQTAIQTGFFMVTNPNTIQFDSSSLSIDQYGATLVSQQVQKVKLSSTTYSTALGQYARLKLQTTLNADITNMFTSGLLFAVRNVYIRQHGSLYGDDNVLDFYFFFYDDIENVLPTFKFAILYNAYTINTPKPYNIRYSVVNWYGGATITNDGSYVPTFLRLAGYFNEGELRSGSQRLALFFTGLDFFENDGVSIYSYDSSCTSSVGSSSTLCRGFTSSASVQQNYLHMRRVEVQFPTTVPSGSVNFFELLIPVKTIAANTNIQLFVSLLRYHDIIPTNSLAQASMKTYFFQPTSVFRLTGSNNLQDSGQFITFPSSAATIMPLVSGYMVTNITSIDNYSVNLSESKVGEIASQISINARHTESYTVVGTNSLNSQTQENGAGFTFATSYDFRTSSQLYFWEGGLSSSIRKCLSFQYNQDGVSNWRYGLFCSMEQATQATVSQVNVTYFQLPYTNGNYLPSTTSFAFSTSMGNIASLKFGAQTIRNPNSIGVDLNSASPTLMMGSKNNRIAWTFATTNPLPENGYVRITFEDPLQIPLIGSNCKFQIATSHTCTVTVPTGIDYQLLFQLTSCSACTIPAGNVQILHYGIDAHVTPIPTNLFLIETLTSNFYLIDSTLPSLHYPSPLSTYNLLTSQNILLVSSQVEVKYPYQQAESEISVSFYTPNNLDLLIGEIVFLNLNTDLSSVNQASINSQVYCFVTQNNAVVHSFLGVTIVNTASVFTVSMKVKNDISLSSSNPLKLVCRNVRMPALSTLSNLPSLTVYKSDGVSKVFSTTTATFPILLSSTITTGSTVSRGSFNTYGSVSTLVFSFTASAVTSGSVFFFIRFSNVYLPTLSQDSSLQCLINSSVVPCTITQSWTLRISGVPLGSTAFSIKIKGVQVPNILTAVASHQNFFIALAQQNLESGVLSLLNFQFLNDINAIAQQTNSFQLTAVQLATTHIQQTNTITFNFTLSNTFLVSGQTYTILVAFPVHWKDLLQLLTPRVSLRRVSTNSFLTLTTTVATMISVTFTWSVTPAALEPFILTLANISNPTESVCVLSRQWVLHVQKSTDDQTLFSRSIPMTSQVPYFRFNNYKKQLVPQWKYPDGKTAYTLNRGDFKTLVTLVLESGYTFTHPLRIALQTSSLFTLDPTNPFAAPGQTSLSFYISASSATPTSQFVVYFQKLFDYFSIYANLPACQVVVVHEAQQIEYVNTQWPLTVPKNGNSGSLVLRYKDQGYLVTRDATISVTVIDGTTFGISVKGDSSKIMKTTRTYPKATFFFSASSSSIVGFQVSIQFSLSATDSLGNNIADRFSLPDNQVLEVSLQGTSGTVYSMSSSAFKSVSTNSIIFRPICPQQGIIYYKVFLNNIYNFSSLTDPQIEITDSTSLRQEIYSNSIDYYEMSSSDYSQKQYGFVQNNPELSAETEISITNLLSSKNYTILAYCETFFGLQSSNLLQLNFSTSSNGGSIQKMTLTFDKNLTLPEKIKALCYLSLFLTIPPANIYSSDKATCSPYIQQYDFSNTLSNLQYFDSVVSPYLTVYFIPDWSKSTDNITNAVLSAYSSSSFTFRLKNFIAQYANYYFTDWELDLPDVFSSTFASLQATSSLQTVSSSIPRIDAAYFIDINQNSQSLTVDQVRLTDSGFIFVGLENKLQNLLKQDEYDNFSPNALVNGLNYFGNSVTYGTQLKEGFSVVERNFTFKNLFYIDNYEWYEVFIAVSEEDPSPFAAKSTIRKSTLINYSIDVSAGFILTYSFICVFLCLFL